MQVSPDTITAGDNGAGYCYPHFTIQSFSFDHMSGVGAHGDLGLFMFMPTTGPLKTCYNHPHATYCGSPKTVKSTTPGVIPFGHPVITSLTLPAKAGMHSR